MGSPGVGGSLSAASDVYFNSPTQSDVLKYDGTLHAWTNDASGTAGPAGATGPMGPTGPAGSTGPAGATTIAGVSGLQTALDSKAAAATTAIVVAWNGTAWPGYSTDPARIRHFYSQDDKDAPAPTGYSTHDVWFAHPEGN